ncbi:MAG: GNAT family N-acetyltransferase [Bacillota bacterium]
MQAYTLTLLTEDMAKEICTWRYDGEYAIYNFCDWDIVVQNGWDLAIKEKREKEFVGILSAGELMGFGRICESAGKTILGVGLKPSWCGKGHGKEVMNLLVQKAKTRYPENIVTLEVRYFNDRARKCYENVGFKVKNQYLKDTFIGESVFYYMEYVEE